MIKTVEQNSQKSFCNHIIDNLFYDLEIHMGPTPGTNRSLLKLPFYPSPLKYQIIHVNLLFSHIKTQSFKNSASILGFHDLFLASTKLSYD